MIVIDCQGRRLLAAFHDAKNEFRQLVFAANNAVNEVISDVCAYEFPETVHYPAGADRARIDNKHARFFQTGAREAVAAIRRAKRALLDVLGYIDGADIPKWAAPTAREADWRSLDHRRAAFLSNALDMDKGFNAGRFDAQLCARTLAAMDDLMLAVSLAAEKYALKEDA